MLRILLLALLPMASGPALADDAAVASVTPPAATAMPAPPAAVDAPLAAAPAGPADAPAAPAPRHKRMTWEERFALANQAHNGRLTLDEAKGGYRGIATHFREIDADNKGYVTTDDIKAWRAARKAARTGATTPAEGPQQPPIQHQVAAAPNNAGPGSDHAGPRPPDAEAAAKGPDANSADKSD